MLCFLGGEGFLQKCTLSWLWRSECQMYCWAQCPRVVSVSLGVTLDSAETPFAKTPFSLRNEKSAQSFSDRSFFVDVRAACPCQIACFSRIWRAWPKFLAGCPQGRPAENFGLWADFSFLINLGSWSPTQVIARRRCAQALTETGNTSSMNADTTAAIRDAIVQSLAHWTWDATFPFAERGNSPALSPHCPEGPRIEKIKFNLERPYGKNQAFNTEWNFQSRMKFSFRAPLWPQKNRAWDWNFQSRMKTSNREWKFQSRMKISCVGEWFFHAFVREWIFSIPGPSGWPFAVESSIAVEDAVESRPLSRFCFALVFRHYSTTIAQLSPPKRLRTGRLRTRHLCLDAR